MIVPMKKLTLLVLKKEQRHALKNLRKLGLLHIEDRPANGTLINELRSEKNDITLAISLLTEYLPKKEKKGVTPPSLLSEEDTLTFVDSVLSLTSSYKSNMEEAARLTGEIASYADWGEINTADFTFLAERSIYLFPASTSVKTYSSLPEDIKTILVGHGKTGVRFLIRSETNALPADLPQDIIPLKLPETSVKALKERLKSLQAKISSYKQEMTKMSAYLNSLHALDEVVSKKLQFEIVHDGMQTIDFGDQDDDERVQLVWLTGYIPCEDEAKLISLAKENSWAYLSQDPEEEDPVPTKIKRNKIVNLISPLIDFLGTVPGYTEPDISLWFLLFFGIFFAMIFGDAGYGAVLFVISIILILKTKAKKQKVPTAFYMFGYLGLMTIIWGTLVCNWFGMSTEIVPPFLKNLAVPAIANFTPEDVRNQNQILLCFTLGLTQLMIAHVVSLFRNIKSPKFLADVGSLSMLGGMYFVVLNLVVDSQKYAINNAVLLAIGAGFALNFIFVNYSKGIGQAIVESLKNIINMLLGVVNVFADIMSYIRLWAVGLAGGAISATVNEMAGPALGGFIIFAGVLLLLFGHGLNYIMNVLSVIVHGVRLNTLEFSNHVGLTWSGFKYEPFNE
ncbi:MULTISPECIES: V-type ATPase 116kDa subunit family protein [unclassified Treponema]|uniref:V-type ATPase 116kDa subunit family protein n=1 Tax=unclassified Treponema TaxID=2638727 RepID=UPI0020A573CF|nr:MULTISPECIES: V-type ATPase 116kDa subunit family protein [unclassified Treponema]UTC67980.1 V-type ATP synthase subunit I [Treponema sp. OMZ 789]UTC70703.1 V-type ATP synthase subunit I [Treponema sp. OMZ 790]UTC73424.1 V-type ATP synthase subunit I [Treponema sp. OMZ 791]